MSSRGDRALCTAVPIPGAARPTVVDWRLQVMVIGPSGRNGNGLCCGASPASASSTAAPAGALRLEGSDKLCAHGYELCSEPLDHGRELGDGGAIACRGCRQVCDSVHRFLLKVPVVRVCGGIVCGAVESSVIVSKQEAPLPVCSH